MSVLQAIILGLLQGLTEFLPVSSSGHLVLGQYLLGIKTQEMLSFDVYVHFGTLLSVCWIFRNDVVQILVSSWTALHTRTFRNAYKSNEHVRLGVAILVGTIPAAYLGLKYHDQVADAFRDPKLVSVNLVLSGLLLYLTRFAKVKEGKHLSVVLGLIIGLAQSIAILPGISRTGSTISSGLYLRLSPALAARFSFLLSIPVIAGAAAVEAKGVIRQGMETGFAPFIIGLVAAAVTGYFAIKILLRIIERGKFSWFSLYCLAVGIAGIIFI